MRLMRRRLQAENGFTMALVMGVLIFATTLGLAAYSAAKGGIGLSGHDRDRKQAYAAAEAGVNFYLSRLNADDNYWSKCWSTPSNGVDDVVRPPWDGEGDDPRVAHARTLPGSTAKYVIEALPTTSVGPDETCDGSKMVDEQGDFRIRSTGFYGTAKRSIVAHFSRTGFLDFIYFTDYETTDPLAYPAGDARADACADAYRWKRSNCEEIRFAPGDVVNGPLHSNDSLLICGTATFGRPGKNDKVETSVANPPKGWVPDSCAGNPTFNTSSGLLQREGVQPVDMPPTNKELKTSADLVLTGTTALVLKGSVIDVITGSPQRTTTIPWPDNGLLYVDTAGVCTGEVPSAQTYRESKDCANVYVTGSYSKDLTIASAKDIVVAGSVTRAGGSDAMLGLIADQFVRVYHPVNRSGCSQAGGNIAPVQHDVTIDAAILSLQHGFTVDNFNCGTGLGNLNVTGAIAQKYRGAVGTSGGSGGRTGYTKNYVYDDRMRYRNPPLFLNPVKSAWKVLRANEQRPAR